MLTFSKLTIASLLSLICGVAYSKDINHIPSKFHGSWSEHLKICSNPENDIYIEIKNNEYLVYEEECYLSNVVNVTTDSFEGEFNCLQSEGEKSKNKVLFMLTGDNKIKVNNVFENSVILQNCDSNLKEKSQDEKEKLPFVGKRFFNFYGGNGTGMSIVIQKNGNTKITLHGVIDSSVLYDGKYSNPIQAEDGMGWLIKEDKIYSLTNGKIDDDCFDGKQCESELYKE